MKYVKQYSYASHETYLSYVPDEYTLCDKGDFQIELSKEEYENIDKEYVGNMLLSPKMISCKLYKEVKK